MLFGNVEDCVHTDTERRGPFMKRLKYTVVLLLALGMTSVHMSVPAQKRRQPATKRQRAPVSARSNVGSDSHLTGSYSLDWPGSEDPREAAERAAGEMAF